MGTKFSQRCAQVIFRACQGVNQLICPSGDLLPCLSQRTYLKLLLFKEVLRTKGVAAEGQSIGPQSRCAANRSFDWAPGGVWELDPVVGHVSLHFASVGWWSFC